MTEPSALQAIILDLDGVITRTATLHAEAWKKLFDEFLQQHATADRPQPPFDAVQDYHDYVDGKPRYDGVKSFLASRGFELPWGDPSDDPATDTICGLGNRKNVTFRELLSERGAEVFDDALRKIHAWRDAGLKVAVVSSSKNCRLILKANDLMHLFDVCVDGTDAERLGLPGKPAPDVFLRAADLLGVPANASAVFEDAISGVQAGSAGHFAVVVGVARTPGEVDPLAEHGADVVVSNLEQFPDQPVKVVHPEAMQSVQSHDESAGAGQPVRPPSALDHADQLQQRWQGRKLALFLDYDGTLTPIVPRPEDATMSESMREVLRELATLCTVAIVSGRDRKVVEDFVQLPELIYAGSHGFDINGPNLHMQHPDGEACLSDLDAAEAALLKKLQNIPGSQVERKRYAIAIHYRHVADEQVDALATAVDTVQADYPKLRKKGGKKIYELQPNIEWNKGYAVLFLLNALGLDGPDALPIYLGDDVTDEDAFRALAERQVPSGTDPGLGIFVGELSAPTAATYSLADPTEVEQFLRQQATRLAGAKS